MSTIHITLTPEGDWETNVDVRNGSGNHPQHLFWSNSHLPQRTNRRKFWGTLPRRFLGGEKYLPQRTPEDKHISLPQNLYNYMAEDPNANAVEKKTALFHFRRNLSGMFQPMIFRMEAARSTLRSVPFRLVLPWFLPRKPRLMFWEGAEENDVEIHPAFTHNLTRSQSLFENSSLHSCTSQVFFVWNSLDRNLSCGMTSTVRRSWAEEKHVPWQIWQHYYGSKWLRP